MALRRLMTRSSTRRAGLGLATSAMTLTGLTGAGTAETPAQAKPTYDVGVFARVPASPGLPEGIVVAPTGKVYVATNPGGNGPTGPPFGVPSELLAYAKSGKLVDRLIIKGQNLASAALPAYGLQALAMDARGFVYAADKSPARILKINPRTGVQRTYASFRDVPSCALTGRTTRCSDTATDLAPFPDYIVFGPGGSLYVSDFQQALIWEVSPGGGKPHIAFTDASLDGGMGPNGMQFRDERTLYLATSLNAPGVGTPGAGRIYSLTRKRDTFRNQRVLYESRPGDGPDGFALDTRGRIYLNFFLANQIAILSPRGAELRRVPANPVENQKLPIPLDSPASSAFRPDGMLLVTNHAVNTRNPLSFAVLTVDVESKGLPLFKPR